MRGSLSLGGLDHPTASSASRYLRRTGFTLVEVTLALGIAAFGLIAIYALLPAALNSESDSVRTTAATSAAAAIVADLRSVPPRATAGALGDKSPRYGISLGRPGEERFYLKSDEEKVASAAGAEFAVRVQVGATPAGVGPTQVRVLVSWPPAASSPGGNFEVVTAIDRN